MSFITNTILIRYGELALKGKNRREFLHTLRQNIKQKLRSLDVSWPVRQPFGYHYIDVPADKHSAMEGVLDSLTEVAGIAWYAPAHRIPLEKIDLASDTPRYNLIDEQVTKLAREQYRPEATFCVRSKRADKSFPLISPEVEKRLGQVIIDNTDWQHVDLKNSDQTFYVNIQPEGIFLHRTKLRGMGGLPVGTAGRVLTLLSGGIDSPVAAYLASKRGCNVDFIHFTAHPLQQHQARQYKVTRLVERLSLITMHSRLFLVPYTHFELAILGKEIGHEVVIFRRFMARVAETLAYQQGALALVTGDNLGQVASQTLENIVSNSQAVSLPILRPVLTMDKQEIIDLAKRIDTYATSVKPYKDCCSIVMKHPRTKSDHQSISKREKEILPDYESLIHRTLSEATCLEYACGELVN